MLCSCDTEEFIAEVKKHHELWDTNLKNYNKKLLTKTQAWLKVAEKFVENFDECSEIDQKEISKKLAHKWRGLRDNYVRYVRQRYHGTEPRVYRYAENLKFLGVRYKKGRVNVEGSDDEALSRNAQDSDDDKRKRRKSTSSPIYATKDEEPEFLELDETPIDFDNNFSVANDEDKAFFDSLLPAVKTLDLDQKLHFRSQVINLVRYIRQGSQKIKLDENNGEFIL